MLKRQNLTAVKSLVDCPSSRKLFSTSESKHSVIIEAYLKEAQKQNLDVFRNDFRQRNNNQSSLSTTAKPSALYRKLNSRLESQTEKKRSTHNCKTKKCVSTSMPKPSSKLTTKCKATTKPKQIHKKKLQLNTLASNNVSIPSTAKPSSKQPRDPFAQLTICDFNNPISEQEVLTTTVELVRLKQHLEDELRSVNRSLLARRYKNTK